MDTETAHEPDFFRALLGDGRPLLQLTALSLTFSGLFAIFLGVTGQFLPHDVAFLGMTPDELCLLHECRIVHFMIHDRISFGGALIAIGILYLWLTAFPLKQGEPWAWAVFAVSGLFGFGSFLAYLGYGYLDSWHGLATLALLPCFILGLVRTFSLLPRPVNWRSILRSEYPLGWRTCNQLGRCLLLTTTVGLVGAGTVIMGVGMTSVFVPEDLQFMGVTTAELNAINPRLIPLIAHDRAGFGGAVACCGLTMFACLWFGKPSRGLWQAIGLAGFAGFSTAVFVHPAIGYTDPLHLAPAVVSAAAFALGWLLCVARARNTPPFATNP